LYLPLPLSLILVLSLSFSLFHSAGSVIGLGFGMVWKSWHWGVQKRTADFYIDLEKREAAAAAGLSTQ
jgi:hypothetical protein